MMKNERILYDLLCVEGWEFVEIKKKENLR